MKALKIMLLLALPITVTAQTESFTISGKIENVKNPSQLYMSIRTPSGSILDSVDVVKTKGKFQFTGDSQGPVLVYLVYDQENKGFNHIGRGADMINFYVDNGRTVVEAKDSVKMADVKGTAIQKEYIAYKNLLQHAEEGIARINMIFSSATPEQRQDTAFANPLRKDYMVYAAEKKELQQNYIKKNPWSHFSLSAIQDQVYNGAEIIDLEEDFNRLYPAVRETATGKEFARQISAAKATAIGAMAPDFTQNDVHDKPVKLSDFRGKYVLLDFWASWCGPCRAENPHVVAAYQKYKDKNFTVLGVSLDDAKGKDKWLKAIADDQLEWTQVSDLQGWKNEASQLYGVRGIPQNYLIDPTGKIVAVNLRGEDLEKKLHEVLGNK